MKKLRIKLLLSLIAFALILVAVISYVNRQILIANIENQEASNRTLIENHILTDMQTVDNAHFYFDTNISDKMEQQLRALVAYYEKNPNIDTWNLQQLKKQYGMDIYILDQTNTVIYTTFNQDKGFDFSLCCKNFSALLDERRESGQFYTDGIDISTTTGQYRKFSYLATPDKKYLLELGLKLSEVPVYQTFNFGKTASYLIEKYDDLLDVQTINAGGVFFSDTESTRITVEHQSQPFQQHFKEALRTMKPTEYQRKLANGYIETNRFIPYEAEAVRGASSKRVVYVKYGNDTELKALANNTKQFWFVLMIALGTAFIMLVVINRLFSKTIQLATYDPLTNVFNRATYISKMDKLLKKRKNNTPGLLLIDLDNFKQVNDQFGHTEGDKILVKTATILNEVVETEGFVVRFGGDEFAIVLYDANEAFMEQLANAILAKIRNIKNIDNSKWSVLSVSMGGVICESPNESELSLFERADKALYQSKKAGKDRYSSYDEVAATE